MRFSKKNLVIAGVLFLAACGGSSVGVRGISSLGSEFVSMFNGATNGEPVDAQSVNIAATSLTADPFNP